jgi:hypothetical protein
VPLPPLLGARGMTDAECAAAWLREVLPRLA